MKRYVLKVPIFLLIGIASALIVLHSKKFNLKNLVEEHEEERDAGVDRQLMTMWQSRAYPDPTGMERKYMDAWFYAQEKRGELWGGNKNTISGAASVLSYNGSWASIGPNTGIGGRILSIAVNPSKGNSVYIGSASGGIWKTYNAQGGTPVWQAVTTGFPVLGVSSIIINPSDTNTIYAGTGEVYRIDSSTINNPNPSITGYNVWKTRGTYGVGILKSSNGGTTWSQVLIKSESALFAIQSLSFDPTNYNTIYAAATDGLYKSTNAGGTWNKILTKTYVSDVVINAANNQQIVVAVGNLQNTDKGVYRTTDGGTTWAKISTGLPATFLGFIKFDNLTSAGNQNTIVASIGVNENTGASAPNELYVSTDFGQTWAAKPNSTHTQWQFWSAHNVAINPTTPNLLIYGGINWFSYNVSGGSSSSISTGHPDVHDIKFDPSNSNYVYIACDGGMYRSINGGGSFAAINNGLGATQFYSTVGVAKSAASSPLIVGGLQDNGMISYNGSSWTILPNGSDGAAAFFDPSNDKNILSSNDARDVYYSSNGEATSATNVLAYWGKTHDSRTGFVAPLAISTTTPKTFYVGTDELFKSTNSGGTWIGGTSNGANPGTNYIDAVNKTAIALSVSSTNANKVYVSTSPFAQYDNDANSLYYNPPSNVQRTTTGNTPFTKINGTTTNVLPNRYIMRFAISPTNDDSVWVAIGGFGTAHVFVTPDGGANWYSKDPGPSSGGLPDVPTNAIMIDPSNSNVIYVGNDLGVYVSPDGGNTWQDFNNGFWDGTLIMDLEPYPGNKILAATHGKGAFISPTYAIGVLPITLTNFTGYNAGNINVLNWNVATQTNIAKYVIERSNNGNNFINISSVSANNLNNSSYSYNDYITTIPNATTLFYRLKIVSADGSFVYSNVVNISLKLQQNLVITGNPFGNYLAMNFTASISQNAEARLLDAGGKLIAKKDFSLQPGTNNLQMANLASLPKGIYLLEFITPNQRYSRKVAKK